jgi:chromosome segregation ATPase
MKTLQEDIDDLDRMVDTNAPKDAIRSQIRLISREVAALQADYDSLAASHAHTNEAKAKVETELSDLKARNKRAMDDWLTDEAEKHRKLIQSKQIRYDT